MSFLVSCLALAGSWALGVYCSNIQDFKSGLKTAVASMAIMLALAILNVKQCIRKTRVKLQELKDMKETTYWRPPNAGEIKIRASLVRSRSQSQSQSPKNLEKSVFDLDE